MHNMHIWADTKFWFQTNWKCTRAIMTPSLYIYYLILNANFVYLRGLFLLKILPIFTVSIQEWFLSSKAHYLWYKFTTPVFASFYNLN